jgi:hypothetical protein
MAEMLLFSECCLVDDARPIRQGDIFEWLDHRNEPWMKLGIVVTADCDITHEKHRGILSYVPLLELKDYLALLCLPGKVLAALAPIREQLLKCIRAYQAANLPGFPEPISDEAAIQWVRNASLDEIAGELALPPGKDRDTFVNLATDYLATDAALRGGSFAALFEAIVRLRARQSRNREQTTVKLNAEIRSYVVGLPGDAFFVGRASRDHGDGYIAYLRLLREIHQSTIAIKQTDLRDSSVRAKRIAALTSPYVYRLTQQLADVFSAIGLPKQYEDARRELLDRVASGGK